MLRNSLALATLLAASFLLSCSKKSAQPACYSGTVVGLTCYDGILIEVDPAYRIGLPTHRLFDDSLMGRNVVAVVNYQDLTSTYSINAIKGQRLYFTYQPDPNRQGVGPCYAADGVRPTVPRLVLSNISTTPCQ